MSSVVYIRLQGFDSRVVDRSVEKLVEVAKKNGASVSGPIPLPSKISRYIVNRSPHIDKKSREQFEVKCVKRLVVLKGRCQAAMQNFSDVHLSAGVEVEVKHG